MHRNRWVWKVEMHRRDKQMCKKKGALLERCPESQPEAQPAIVPQSSLMSGPPLGKSIKSPESSCENISLLP